MGIVAIFIFIDYVEKMIPVAVGSLLDRIHDQCSQGGTWTGSIVRGHDAESSKLRVRHADVHSRHPEGLIAWVTPVPTMVFHSKHPKAILPA
jgi:hypothetical protein